MHVVIPVKRFDQAKQRLAPSLGPAQRAELARAMLCDVLAVLAAVAPACGIEGVTLVSDEPHLPPPPAGLRLGVHVPLRDGLNAAVAAALQALAAQPPRPVLVLHADLPLLRGDDLLRLAAAARDGAPPLIAVPDRHGQGTNALLLDHAGALAPQFGPHSLARHAAAARQRGRALRVLPLASIGLDVDQPQDLAALVSDAAAAGLPQRHSVALAQAWLDAPRPEAPSARPPLGPRPQPSPAG